MSEDTRFRDLSDELEVSMGSVGHIAIFNLIANQLITYHYNQEQTYKLSFSKRGEIGIWMNLGRKMDRLDPIAEKLFEHSGNSILLVDVLVDMAIYAIKWLAVIYEIRSEDLENWVVTTYATAMRMLPEQALKLFERTPLEEAYKSLAFHLNKEVHQLTDEEKRGVLDRYFRTDIIDEDREEL